MLAIRADRLGSDGVRNVVVYANIGHSVSSDDGGHFYAGNGFKVVIGR